MMRRCLLFIAYLYGGLLCAEPTEIVLWHSLSGSLAEEVKQLTALYNQSQNDYVIKPVYKGEYSEALTSFAAAYRAGQPPAIMQVYEAGTAVMLSAPGIIKPFAELMQEFSPATDINHIMPALQALYQQQGKWQAMPFNISLPLIYYNADTLAQMGVNQDNFPKTWQAMEKLAAKLQKAGFDCAYTTAYPSWILIDSFAALHGLPLVDNQQYQAVFNNQTMLHHLQRLKRWQDNHYFQYGGRANNASILFTSGRCVMFSQSSGAYQSLAKLVDFKVGIAPMPLDIDASTHRYNNTAGGAALWTIAPQSENVYRGIALFYKFLAQPKIQARWYQHTGYLPLGLSGSYAALMNNKEQLLTIAKADFAVQQTKVTNQALIPQNQLRTINDEALEAMFAHLKTPNQALNDAVSQANFTLQRFACNTGIREKNRLN